MPIHNSILNNNNKEVNSFIEDILEISKEQDKQEEKDNLFYSLVPKIHLSAVRNLVKTQFNNNLDEYLKTIPKFLDPLIWSKRKKDDADEKFISNRTNRDKKAYKKNLILHSAQLLKLIGFNRQKVATKAMVKEYVEDMENSDDYINSLRLINAKGKIIKLDTNKEKQFKKLARMNKIADTMDLIAKSKGFTNSMMTLTLPPVFHPNPKNNNCSYGGQSPKQAHKQLMDYWKAFRAMLSNNDFIFGENLIGLQVIELQQDSTLHLHSIFYHSKEDEQLLTDCLFKVQDNFNSKKALREENVKFDIQYSNQKEGDENYQRGSSYLMKYLYKTHTTYDDKNPDDSVLKNQACRWFYGIRSFNFFGFNGAITKFDFLIKNYKSYENTLPDEIKNCLKTDDLYSFIKNYNQFFTNEYNKDSSKRTFIGVIFNRGIYKKSFNQEKQTNLVLELLYKLEKEIDVLRNKLKLATDKGDFQKIEQLNKVIDRKIAKIESLETTNEVAQEKIDEALKSFELVLIEKKIFSIFQSNEQNKDLTTISVLNLDDLINANVKQSFENALSKQDELDFLVNFSKGYYKEQGTNLLTLSLLEKINISLNKKIKNLDKSIGVQLFKAIQGKGFSPDLEEKTNHREQVLEQIHYETWLEQRQIFNY
ncbi:replication endonuclease [Burkholderia vietnamiensis]|uniref:replication endonuclease n=1 Tax=Burkholderia vietnamiensis TaxID=60552 RepID=UPI00159317A4|nr:replication endonuclease [Burkholderia vietnamiensis]